jgi:hypothetical protein
MDEAERCTSTAYIYNASLLVCGRPETLKEMPEVTPAGTRRWEIEADGAPGGAVGMLARLRGTEGMRDATLFGQTIHVLAAEEVSAEELARRAETRVEHVRPITPTLEDVFVTLTAHAAARGGAGGREEAETGRRGDVGRPEQAPPAAAAGPPQTRIANRKSKIIKPHLLAGFLDRDEGVLAYSPAALDAVFHAAGAAAADGDFRLRAGYADRAHTDGGV